jgi:8-oxo-dGTP diphosphatase
MSENLCAICGHGAFTHRAYDNSCEFEDCRCDGFAEREPPRVGVAVLVWYRGRLLFHLRKGKHGPGTWSFPGGHLDWGEEPTQAAARELREECGELAYTPLVPYKRCPYVNTLFKTGKQYITLYYECELVAGEPAVMEPEKCERWEWFAPNALPSPLFDPLENKRLNLSGAMADSPDDEGELEFRVGLDGKLVFMDFGKSVKWISMPPKDARDIAATLTKWADEAEKHG